MNEGKDECKNNLEIAWTMLEGGILSIARKLGYGISSRVHKEFKRTTEEVYRDGEVPGDLREMLEFIIEFTNYLGYEITVNNKKEKRKVMIHRTGGDE